MLSTRLLPLLSACASYLTVSGPCGLVPHALFRLYRDVDGAAALQIDAVSNEAVGLNSLAVDEIPADAPSAEDVRRLAHLIDHALPDAAQAAFMGIPPLLARTIGLQLHLDLALLDLNDGLVAGASEFGPVISPEVTIHLSCVARRRMSLLEASLVLDRLTACGRPGVWPADRAWERRRTQIIDLTLDASPIGAALGDTALGGASLHMLLDLPEQHGAAALAIRAVRLAARIVADVDVPPLSLGIPLIGIKAERSGPPAGRVPSRRMQP